MLFKLFMFLLVIGSCSLFGISGEHRVTARRAALAELAESIKAMKSALIFQSMTVSAALSYSGRGALKSLFESCASISGKKPSLCGSEVARESWEAAPPDGLEEQDAELVSAFMEAVFRSVSAEETTSACTRYLCETSSAIKEINETSLKKARLKKTLCILGGIGLCVIFI